MASVTSGMSIRIRLSISFTNIEPRPLNLNLVCTISELTSTMVVDKAGHDLKQDSLKVTGSMFVLQSKLPDLVARVEELLAQAGQDPNATAPVETP